MLLIFWDTKEETKVKKEIKNSLGRIYRNLLKDSFFSMYKKHSVKLIFTDSKKIKELNKTYRKKNEATDVLSFRELDTNQDFPLLQEKNSLGEIYINYQWIKEENEKMEKWGSGQELPSILLLHGLLHLLGFDHEKDDGEMEKLEKKLREKLIK